MKTSANPVDAPSFAPAPPALVIWGRVLLVVGLLLLAFYAFFYDTSLGDDGAVSNAHLLLNRLIGSLVGIVVSFTGALCLIAQAFRSPVTKSAAKAPPAPSAPSAPAKPESQPRSVRGEILQGRRRR